MNEWVKIGPLIKNEMIREIVIRIEEEDYVFGSSSVKEAVSVLTSIFSRSCEHLKFPLKEIEKGITRISDNELSDLYLYIPLPKAPNTDKKYLLRENLKAFVDLLLSYAISVPMHITDYTHYMKTRVSLDTPEKVSLRLNALNPQTLKTLFWMGVAPQVRDDQLKYSVFIYIYIYIYYID